MYFTNELSNFLPILQSKLMKSRLITLYKYDSVQMTKKENPDAFIC